MGKVYSISMNKGGVSKTSLVTNISGVLSQDNKKVLIIDSDGQGNASMAFGLNPNNIEDTLYDVLVGDKSLKDVMIEVDENIDIVPSNNDMNFLEFDILPNVKEYQDPFALLKKKVEKVRDDYDYILIDTPPSMGLVAGNVLATADKVIVPFAPEMFAVTGLIRVIEAINDFKEKQNPSLDIEGVVGVMVDSRTKLHTEMLEQANKYCESNGIKMYDTIIPKSIRFANSFAYEGKPATLTDFRNHLVMSYFDLTKEMV